MNTQATLNALAIAIQAGEPVMILGDPGTGKTSGVRALGTALDMPVETVIASLREPSDFGGLPVIVDHEMRLMPPNWAIRLSKEARAICFIDEITTTAPATQAALLRVIHERVVGDLHLGDGIAMVAAANPPDQAAGGWDLAAPLANRFCHLKWSLNFQDWCDGVTNGWPAPSVPRLPENWKVGAFQQYGLITQFIRTNPVRLLEVPKEESRAGEAWASPRSWDMAARLLTACASVGADQGVKGELVSGCVGNGPALEFFTYVNKLDLPDPEECLRNPSGIKFDKMRTDQRYALFNAVASVVVASMSVQRYEQAFKVMYLAVKGECPDVAFSAVQNLIRHEPEMTKQPPEMAGWYKLLVDAGVFKQAASFR